jgi:hypothetical protein
MSKEKCLLGANRSFLGRGRDIFFPWLIDTFWEYVDLL